MPKRKTVLACLRDPAVVAQLLRLLHLLLEHVMK